MLSSRTKQGSTKVTEVRFSPELKHRFQDTKEALKKNESRRVKLIRCELQEPELFSPPVNHESEYMSWFNFFSLMHLMDVFSFSAEARGQGLLHASEVSRLHSLVGSHKGSTGSA